MLTKAFLYALATTSVVNAHGRIDVVVGDKGGNGTALGVKGAVVPGGGPNYMTEPDTTTFWSHTFATDQDDGFTDVSGALSPAQNLAQSMALAGNRLPQISSGGFVTGNWHVVTDDGCGPLQAAIDTSASSKWATATNADVTTDLPGKGGFCTNQDSGDDQTPEAEKESIIGSAERRLRRTLVKLGLVKRAKNVNKSWAFKITIPEDAICTGVVNGISGLCQIKVSNNNQNGPFGGTFLVQMPGNAKRSTIFSA